MPPRGAHENYSGDAAPNIMPPLVWYRGAPPFRAHYGRGRPGAREAMQQANSCGRRGDLGGHHYMLTLRVEGVRRGNYAHAAVSCSTA